MTVETGASGESSSSPDADRAEGEAAPNPGRPTPILADVAKIAGVSIATASKALNNRGEVAAATRARVLEAAESISFVPNPLARGLLAGRSGTVGLITGDLQGRFVLPILQAVEDAFGSGRINAFLCDAREDSIREQHHLKALLSRRVDGLVIVGSRTDPRPSIGHDLPVPVVYVYAPSEDPDDLSLVPDNVAAGRMAVEHLVASGKSRIAHISGDPRYLATTDRARGVTDTLDALGLQLVGEPMLAEWSEQWGRSACRALLEREPHIDGFVCGSDQIARGALDTLRDLDREVPGDVAVVGFDNWAPMVEHSRPPLTSVDPNLSALGREAAQRLMSLTGGASLDSGVHFQAPRLVIRGSTVFEA